MESSICHTIQRECKTFFLKQLNKPAKIAMTAASIAPRMNWTSNREWRDERKKKWEKMYTIGVAAAVVVVFNDQIIRRLRQHKCRNVTEINRSVCMQNLPLCVVLYWAHYVQKNRQKWLHSLFMYSTLIQTWNKILYVSSKYPHKKQNGDRKQQERFAQRRIGEYLPYRTISLENIEYIRKPQKGQISLQFQMIIF